MRNVVFKRSCSPLLRSDHDGVHGAARVGVDGLGAAVRAGADRPGLVQRRIDLEVAHRVVVVAGCLLVAVDIIQVEPGGLLQDSAVCGRTMPMFGPATVLSRPEPGVGSYRAARRRGRAR